MTAANPLMTVRERYDRATIFLHWITAVLVVVLFVTAQIWSFLTKGTPPRHNLQTLHISWRWRPVRGQHLW